MMSVRHGKRNKHYNYNYSGSQRALNLQLTTQPLLLLLALMLCCEVILMETTGAAELPAELLLEDIGLLKSMDHAQHQKQQQQQQQLQQHHHASQQKEHVLHEQTKRYGFDKLNSASASVDIDDMQQPEMSPADIARYERELFLQSAIDESSLAAADDDVELPWEPESMEQHADLMEHAIDYNQHQPSAGSIFSKLHHPHQLHHPPQPKHHQQHRLSGDAIAAANSVTPQPMPVAAPQRQCSFVVSTKVTGVCQAAPVGSPCMAGEHMDVYNQDCM